MSLRGGGPISGHSSHQKGVDVDVRPMRGDGQEAPVTIFDSAYSPSLTQELVNLIRANPVLQVRTILFNDKQVSGVTSWSGHDNHLHVSFKEPVAPGGGAGSAPASPWLGGTYPEFEFEDDPPDFDLESGGFGLSRTTICLARSIAGARTISNGFRGRSIN